MCVAVWHQDLQLFAVLDSVVVFQHRVLHVTVIFCICGYGLSPMSGKCSVVIGLKADLN